MPRRHPKIEYCHACGQEVAPEAKPWIKFVSNKRNGPVEQVIFEITDDKPLIKSDIYVSKMATVKGMIQVRYGITKVFAEIQSDAIVENIRAELTNVDADGCYGILNIIVPLDDQRLSERVIQVE